jgi:hypothetical protein
VIAALVRLGNALDDRGMPSLTIDNIRLEVIAMKVRSSRANDNDNQPRTDTWESESSTG